MKKILIKKDQQETIFENQLTEDHEIVLEKDAKLFYILALNKGTDCEKLLRFDLQGEGASLEMIGILYGKGKEKFQFKTEVIHTANNTYGHINMKGIMDDEAKTDYFGMIQIPKKTSGADAYLSHHTLLLSKKAGARTVPSLEIEANDLKAGHSASVGQIDERALFYMLSRGIAESTARRLLIEGFLEELIQKIPDIVLANKTRENLFATS